MSISAQKLEVPVTYDSYTPSGSSSSSPRSSSCTSINGALYHKSSEETLQSHQESISNSSVHTSTAAIDKDRFELFGQDPSSSDHKSLHSLLKTTFDFRNQSLSTVCSIRDPESNRGSSAISTPWYSLSSLPSLESEAESSSSLFFTPRSSLHIFPTLSTDPSPSPSPSPVHAVLPSPPLDDDGGSQLSSTMEIMEISTPNTPSIRPADFLPSPTNRMGTTSRTLRGMVTLKDKKGVLGFMTDLLNSNKRPEITTPHDLVHLTHVRFDSSTRQYIGLPKGWQRLLHDSGISKSDQEKDPLAVVKIVEFYQDGGGGDIWDKMGRARAAGSSRSPPIPGMVQAAYPGPSKKSVNIPVAERRAPQPPTVPQQQSKAVVSLAKTAGATPRRREKKKEGKANDADIVKRLQRICTDADPTRLYRNLVKIGQG